MWWQEHPLLPASGMAVFMAPFLVEVGYHAGVRVHGLLACWVIAKLLPHARHAHDMYKGSSVVAYAGSQPRRWTESTKHKAHDQLLLVKRNGAQWCATVSEHDTF